MNRIGNHTHLIPWRNSGTGAPHGILPTATGGHTALDSYNSAPPTSNSNNLSAQQGPVNSSTIATLGALATFATQTGIPDWLKKAFAVFTQPKILDRIGEIMITPPTLEGVIDFATIPLAIAFLSGLAYGTIRNKLASMQIDLGLFDDELIQNLRNFDPKTKLPAADWSYENSLLANVQSTQPDTSPSADLPERIQSWITNKSLDAAHKSEPVKNRLLEGVRQGGILLPTISADMEDALSIFELEYIKPTLFKDKTAYSPHGLAHATYGEIVFILNPNMPTDEGNRQRLYHIATKTGYSFTSSNSFSKLQWLTLADAKTYDPERQIDEGQIIAILVPEHLYNELYFRANDSDPLLNKMIAVLGTGTSEAEFKTGADGEAKIGNYALFLYELVYFKITEMFTGDRQKRLRQIVEGFAATIDQADENNLSTFFKNMVPLLPEVLRLDQPQLNDTLNAIKRACLLAKELNGILPFDLADILLAILLRDAEESKKKLNEDSYTIGEDTDDSEIAPFYLNMMGIDSDSERGKRILNMLMEHDLYDRLSRREISVKAAIEAAGNDLVNIYMLNLVSPESNPNKINAAFLSVVKKIKKSD